MTVVRVLAVVAFVAGLGLLVAGFVRSWAGDDETIAAAPSATIAEAWATATPTRTPAPTDVPTEAPTPTPTPYDGAVARLKLPKFNVDSAIEAIGLLPTNTLDTPRNPYNTGWYDIEGYGKPGFGSNSVFSAHVDYFPNIKGPFYNLAKLQLGDIVIVTMDDGTEYQYQIIRTKRYDVRTIPMGDLIWPQDRPEGKEWVTLITCGGRFQQTSPSGAGEYLDRDVVVAERIAS